MTRPLRAALVFFGAGGISFALALQFGGGWRIPGASVFDALSGTWQTALKGHEFWAYAALTAAWAAVVITAGRRPPSRFRSLAITAAIACAAVLVTTQLYSLDVYEYLMRGRVLAIHHENPFLTPPASFTDDPYFPLIAWRRVVWLYGPVWLFVVSGVAALQASIPSSVLLIRVLMAAAHLLNGWLLWKIHDNGEPGDRARRTAFYLLCPLAIWESAGNGHCDFLVVTFLLAGYLFDLRGRPLRASAALMAAAMVKIYAGPILFFYFWAQVAYTPSRRRWRTAMTLIAVPALMTLALYVPFVHTYAALKAPFTGGSANGVTQSWAAVLIDHVRLRNPFVLIGLGNAAGAIAIYFGTVASWKSGRWRAASAWFAFAWCAVGAAWFQPWYTVLPLALVMAEDMPELRRANVAFVMLAPMSYFARFCLSPESVRAMAGAAETLVQVLPLGMAVGLTLRARAKRAG